MECDDRDDFSKKNLVNCVTSIKLKLLDLIENYVIADKTLYIDMEKGIEHLLKH